MERKHWCPLVVMQQFGRWLVPGMRHHVLLHFQAACEASPLSIIAVALLA
jgi:hypothetical protein